MSRKAKQAHLKAAQTPFFTELGVFVTYDRLIGQSGAYLNVGTKVPVLVVRYAAVQGVPMTCSRRTGVQSCVTDGYPSPQLPIGQVEPAPNPTTGNYPSAVQRGIGSRT